MSSTTIPLAVPQELERQIRAAAKKTNLSIADVMRQSIMLGLPELEERLSPLAGLKPLTRQEIHRAYEVPNPEFDALEHHCASLPQRPPSFDET
jgi:hypothetical protein